MVFDGDPVKLLEDGRGVLVSVCVGGWVVVGGVWGGEAFTSLCHRAQRPRAATFIIKRCDVNSQVIATVGSLHGTAVRHGAAVVVVSPLVAVSLHSVA